MSRPWHLFLCAIPIECKKLVLASGIPVRYSLLNPLPLFKGAYATPLLSQNRRVDRAALALHDFVAILEVLSRATVLTADERMAANEHSTTGWYSLPPEFRTCAALSPNAVLLETARPDGDTDRSLLFLEPYHQLTAWTANDLEQLLREMDQHLSAGAFLAGFFHYECGDHFVGIAAEPLTSSPAKEPIAWLGVYKAPIEFDHSTGMIRGTFPPTQMESLPPGVPPSIQVGDIEIHPKEYLARFERIQRYLHAGDTYQVNLTDRISGVTACPPLAIYEYFLKQQPVPFAALINKASGALLSFSPELFFRTSQRQIAVRPMKGTWARGRNLTEDREAAHRLAHDEKNRSEHVMIVDLLRNDLGRICEFGSIKPEKLFHAERYNTLFQMTSTISGTLRADLAPSVVLKSLFPSGSITGAPKRRTMEIIRELERHPRGVYTGSIGYFGPGGESCFNVAIRTMEFTGSTFCFGIGSGITAGSDGNEEYEECRLKAAFLHRRAVPFSLIETMRAAAGIPLLDLHMKRLAESAEYFDIRYDAPQLRYALANAAQECGSACSRIRVELNQQGLWKITASPLPATPWSGRVLLADERISSKEIFHHHKTTNREIYDRHLASARAAGLDEVMFVNEHGCVTECAISNILLRLQGRWTTPALVCGVLPGVYRTTLLDSPGSVIERELHLEDIRAAERIIVCNAIHGVRPVKQIETSAGNIIWIAPG
jgi:para-aminobenzoate synthetase/4-amino-4-deoxychorismate lyase